MRAAVMLRHPNCLSMKSVAKAPATKLSMQSGAKAPVNQPGAKALNMTDGPKITFNQFRSDQPGATAHKPEISATAPKLKSGTLYAVERRDPARENILMFKPRGPRSRGSWGCFICNVGEQTQNQGDDRRSIPSSTGIARRPLRPL